MSCVHPEAAAQRLGWRWAHVPRDAFALTVAGWEEGIGNGRKGYGVRSPGEPSTKIPTIFLRFSFKLSNGLAFRKVANLHALFRFTFFFREEI